MNSDELLTVADVAKILNVPVSWVYDRTRKRGSDGLPHVKLGKYVRFQLPEILQWLERKKG
jgi:excisionase family DNA binding protein